MTGTALALNVSEATIQNALIEARGDIFIASQMLGVTALKLDRAIRASAHLQNVFVGIEQVKALEGYDKMSAALVEQEIQRRLQLYRADALDSLHDLATMGLSDNSAQNQVKLAAAVRLAGETNRSTGDTDLDQTLRILNDQYHKEAPRIKSIRERIVEFETPSLPADPA